ncbi:MAG TPA: hypothetical protein VJO33_13710 [Gemmatimonadaceae bacterium]|nr:hypothetical protein [Gemmatimonadaceae bacterium]
MLVILIALAVALAVVLVLRRRKALPAPRVRVGEIPRVLQLVSETHHDGTFAVFLFGERGQSPASADALNVQFSIENGQVGLDWVLLAQPNLAARDRVAAFFAQRRRPLVERTENGVSYLRVETGDLAGLCRDLLRSVFGVTDQQDMVLIPEGFDWTSTDSSRGV